MRIITAGMLLLILFMGSVIQTYEQTFDKEGDSVIKKEFDANLFLSFLGDDAAQKIEETCASVSSLKCSYSDGTMVTTETFGENDGYYSFESGYGLFYIEYKLIINRIPSERFSALQDDLLIRAGLANETGQSGLSIDFSDKENNALGAKAMRDTGTEIKYIVIVPGDILSATAGEVSGTVSDSTAEFSLSEVLAESEPIVIYSREINWGALLLILTVIVLIAFAGSFF